MSLRIVGIEFEDAFVVMASADGVVQSGEPGTHARQTGTAKKQVVPPDLLEEVFELNMQLEEFRMNKKMDEADDPSLAQDIAKAKEHLIAKQNKMLTELKASWTQSDALVDRAAAGEPVSERERTAARNAMLNILNTRKYLANLLREIDEVLET